MMSVSVSPRCPTCKSTSERPRNLAVFIDGTSNKPGSEETNIIKLYNLVSVEKDPELKQRAYYLESIGANDVDRSGKTIPNRTGMAIAWNVKKNVINAYKWLAALYREGDQTYLFGFSRGAYQVRALASMIHEVGLVREITEERIEQAYRIYCSIDPNKPETRNAAINFKQDFCRLGLRIHFVGVWDTVSSLGLVKKDVHVTASASVTNACHFRHALALDERRVKFMPEYFSKMNAHHSNIQSSRSAISDVKEVWFAGCHSDVGGSSRPQTEPIPNLVVDERSRIHAGNVPLLWMRREAEAAGLIFKSERFAWYPEDVDLGRKDTMKYPWKFLEILPIRHQISFSGTGKHEWRSHLFRPRLVIPQQRIHFSVFPDDVYTPRATLGYGVHIPTRPQKASGGLWKTELWTTGLLDEEATLTSLLSDPQETLRHLGEVLLLLHLRLENGETQTIPNSQLLEAAISKLSGSHKFALTVIYDAASKSEIPQELVEGARKELCAILSSPEVDITRTLYVLRFSTRHRRLRRHFITHREVIALMHALERTTGGRSEHLFPLVINCLCYLIDDDDQRGNVINALNAQPDGTDTGKTRLSSVLEVTVPSHLIASLKMLASLARHKPALCEELKPRIIDLSKKGSGPIGSAAVETLVALDKPQVTRDIPFSNILGYLDNTLPRLDVEVGSTYPPEDTGDLPPVLRVNGSGELDEEFMRKLLRSTESCCVDLRTRATLALLKICNDSAIRDFCSGNKVLDIFMRQLRRKETSLLAAYALKTCLRHNMWTSEHFPRAAQLIVTMFDRGWFDDAVGRVEGSEIFGDLMTSDVLRQQVIASGIVTTIKKKFEGGECHEVRMNLICLDILVAGIPEGLKHLVTESLEYLQHNRRKTQIKGVKILSALAQTTAGEEAIKPHVIDIVKMLLPHTGSLPVPRSQIFGATAAVYDLCNNETLRKLILGSDEYTTFMRLRRDPTLFPQT